MPFIITDVLESNEFNRFQLLNCSITSGLELKSIASIRIAIDGEEYSSTGSGNGGYDAFMNALKKVLKTIKTGCHNLIDYQIRIPRGGRTDALTECIITWEKSDKTRFKTIGVDSDQVIAAVNATLKMLNLQETEKLSHRPVKKNNQKVAG